MRMQAGAGALENTMEVPKVLEVSYAQQFHFWVYPPGNATPILVGH